jgi:nitrile hydratase subunit beta
MQGFGPIVAERDEPFFHEDWERRVFGIAAALFQRLAGGEYRHAIERMDPAHYLASSYYEHWLAAAETLLVEKGLLTVDDLMAKGARPQLSAPVAPTAHPPPSVAAGSPRFEPGDQVRVKNMHPTGHTRCPRYVRGRTGTVVRVEGMFNLDDVTAHGGEPRKEPVYVVRFEARELWGPGNADHALHLEMWESYLE